MFLSLLTNGGGPPEIFFHICRYSNYCFLHVASKVVAFVRRYSFCNSCIYKEVSGAFSGIAFFFVVNVTWFYFSEK